MKKEPSQSQTFAGGILNPVSAEDFFNEYWEKQPLHIERESSNPFEHLISDRAIESLLSTHSIAFPTVQLSKTGEVIPASDYTDHNNHVVNSRIVERFKAGCTVVVSHAHKLHPPLMDFCREVQAGLGMPCQTNTYLSPPGNQGFNPHHDTHDVFILQVSGKKTFSFYGGGAELPTVADRFDSQVHSVGEKTEEIHLSAGDTLYIPRGFVHDAVADAEVASLHITLGVYPLLMHSLVTQIISSAMQEDSRLRASALSSPTLHSSTLHSSAATKSGSSDLLSAANIKAIVEEHITDENISAAISELQDVYALGAKLDISNQLSNVSSNVVNASTKLRVNPTALINVDKSGAGIKLRTHGAVLELQSPMDSAADWVLAQSELVVSAIPALNSDQQMALATQMLNHGLLQVI